MKILNGLLIILLVSIYKAKNCTATLPTQASDCHNSEKTIENQYRCCYVYQKYFFMGTLKKGYSCHPLTKIEFENIKEVIKSFKEGVEKMGGIYETLDIQCTSNYLYISLLSLMIFLL